MPGTSVPSPVPGISVLVVKQCLQLAVARGLDMPRLLAESGFQAERLEVPGGWIGFHEVEPLLRRGLERLGDPLAGLHAANYLNLTSFGVMGFVAQTSSTLRDLIDTSCRYERLISDVGTTTLRHEPGLAFWQWECSIADPLVARHATECILGTWISRLQLMQRQRQRPLCEVHFRHAAPAAAPLREYEDFFGCPVRFGRPASALVLPAAMLGEPLALANPQLRQTLEQHAREMLAARQGSAGVLEQARAALRQMLGQAHAPSREEVAARLGMSGRSLHRKLEEAGSSFRELLDELRFDLARAALHDRTLSVEAVSQRLGFQESQSFIRWFKRLAGTTPGEYRAQQRA